MIRHGFFPSIPARGTWFAVLLLAFGWMTFPGLCAAQQTAAPAAGVTAPAAAPAATPAAAPDAEKPKRPTTEELLAQYPPVSLESSARAAGILILFIIIATLIATRKIPAMVALPIMAFGIGLIAGIPLFDPPGTPGKELKGLLATVIEGLKPPNAGGPQGGFRLYDAIIYTLLGGMFARFISDSKIAERVIKYAAEFGGEDPFLLSMLMSVIVIMIFTAIGGLPAIIMVGTVVFPVLLSLGVPPLVCGGMLLLAFPIGATLNPASWAIASSLFKVEMTEVMAWFMRWAAIQIVVLFSFLSIEFLRMKRTTVTLGGVLRSIATVIVIGAVCLVIGYMEQFKSVSWVSPALYPAIDGLVAARGWAWTGVQWLVGIAIVVGIVHTQFQYWTTRKVTSEWNMLAPIMPIILIMILGFTLQLDKGNLVLVIPAFIGSLAFAYLTTPRERGMQRLGKSIMDGISDVGAPVVLMIGIGMLVNAAMHDTTRAVLTPIMANFVPTTPIPYVIFFVIVAPLSLYRGPLNEFGLGAGVANLLQTFLPPLATMGAVKSVGMLQDPTTTQNVWVCGYLKLDINALLFKLFFYSMALCLMGLILSAWLAFGAQTPDPSTL